jgi:hypothetical protein
MFTASWRSNSAARSVFDPRIGVAPGQVANSLLRINNSIADSYVCADRTEYQQME